ncbi:MAG: MATE family efflux transporter [Eubacterium sp.]|jgi:putative MATE family efflux protein|nr:MATE family efflux transporter [Eubacterium sp.]
MKIQLSEHFTYKKLLRFVLPSIVMMIFTSIYGVVDGLFVSNYVGKTAFAAVNLVMPLLMMLSALGFMMGTGGSAIVAKTLGQGDKERANRYFSMMVYVTVVGGVVLTVLGLVFLRPIVTALGAEGEMIGECLIYGRISLASLTFFMVQNVFQSFFVAAEKPHLGLGVMVAAGVTNMVLDYLFIAILGWGIAGAAAATAAGETVGGIVPLIYFFRKNTSLLRLTKTKIKGKILLKACTNGSSELMTNLSMSLVNMLYNVQLMRLAGEDGVAAYGVIMYVNFIFLATFIGYSIGSAPIVGYHFGAQNHYELKNLFQKSMRLIGGWGGLLMLLAFALSGPLAQFFVGYDAELLAMTSHGLRLYALAFLVSGFNIYGSAFFTALNNGLVSAVISFLRTLVFQMAAVLILPRLLGLNGIWLAVLVAELLALGVTLQFFIRKKKVYHYL